MIYQYLTRKPMEKWHRASLNIKFTYKLPQYPPVKVFLLIFTVTSLLGKPRSHILRQSFKKTLGRIPQFFKKINKIPMVKISSHICTSFKFHTL